MATSIIRYKKKKIDINDNLLIFSLYFIKVVAKSKDLPRWFEEYIENVIDVVIDLRPVGWGYMKLEEYLVDDEINRKPFYLEILNDTITYLKRRKSDIVDNIEANYILDLKGVEKWEEESFVKNEYIIEFLEEVKNLLKNE